jgi:hypothetical protein
VETDKNVIAKMAKKRKIKMKKLYEVYNVRTSDGRERKTFRTLHQCESFLGQHLFQSGQIRLDSNGKAVEGLVEHCVEFHEVEMAKSKGLPECEDGETERRIAAFKYKGGYVPSLVDSDIKVPKALPAK